LNNSHNGTHARSKNLPVIQGNLGGAGTQEMNWVGTFLRVLLVGLIGTGIRLNQEKFGFAIQEDADSISIEQVKEFFWNADTIKEERQSGLFSVKDVNARCLGYVARTLPFTKDIVGYRGPSDLLLFFDPTMALSSVRLLKCYDTPEHVLAVKNDEQFLRQFEGKKLGQAGSQQTVDGVSGATLTSLAIAETISFRISGQKPSLRFPDPIVQSDLSLFKLPLFQQNKSKLSLGEEVNGRCSVFMDEGAVKKRVGFVQRTGPIVDSIGGYQGPSELVLWVDSEEKVQAVALRQTFDNTPYSNRLNLDDFFWEVFQKKTLLEVSKLDLQEEEVEGVSGATMTSLAVGDTIVETARELIRRKKRKSKSKVQLFYWSWHDLGTLIVVLTGLMIVFSRAKGWKTIRLLWRVILVAYFGLFTGNLLSLVVLSGAAANGFAWRFAPGLLFVVFVSVVIPIGTKRNVYCSHLCPHGAAQQLVKGWFGTVKTISIPAKWSKPLKFLPGCLLVLAVLVTVTFPEHSLASWEPFHGYRWPIAGWASLVLLILSFILSGWIPMAYCRFGCPTGRFLEYIRHNAAAGRICFADIVGCVLVLILFGRLMFL